MRNLATKAKKIARFIKRKAREAKAKGVIVGLSGGVDSSLVCTLAVKALGRKKVLGIMIPEKGISNPKDLEDAKKLAGELGIRHKIHDMGPVVRAFKVPARKSRYPLGNLKARIRMCILYSYANLLNYLVLGTGNRSELLSGYFTKYGDGGVDALPIGSLYKTEVWEMSRELGLPKEIVDKTPTAGLWKGQTDEGEMGMKYVKLDSILYLLTEKKFSADRIAKKLNIRKSAVEWVTNTMEMRSHKLSMPEICRL